MFSKAIVLRGFTEDGFNYGPVKIKDQIYLENSC